MNKYVALLRGINVSGHNIIKMAKLKEVLVQYDFVEVSTYLQSGNVVFQSALSKVKELEEKIHNIILQYFELDITIIVYPKNIFIEIFKNNPFSSIENIDLKKIMFIYTKGQVDKSLWEELAFNSNYDEEFILGKNVIYIYYTNNYGKSKVSGVFLERKLKISCTARNWNTANKLTKTLQIN